MMNCKRVEGNSRVIISLERRGEVTENNSQYCRRPS